MNDAPEHLTMLEEIMDTLRRAGRKDNFPSIAGFGATECVAENSSETEIHSATGKVYILSIIEKED